MHYNKILTSGVLSTLLLYVSVSHASQDHLFGTISDPKQQYKIAMSQLENQNLSTKESVKGLKWLKLAAAHQYPEAQYTLGLYHQFSIIDETELDLQKAVRLYEVAASKGHATAQFQLSSLLLSKDLAVHDEARGLHWLTQSAAGDDVDAQYSLAMFYHAKPTKTAEDFHSYLEWLTRSAENGYLKAQYALGSYYIDCKTEGFDPDKAAHWFYEAAKQGDAVSQYNLALIYEKRGPDQENQQLAIHWFRQASEQGMPDAMFNLGKRYLFGQNITPNPEMGMELVRSAAKHGNPAAQTLLASHHIHGQFLDKNYTKAMQLYKKAAQHHYPEAQYQIALMFARGQGVEKSEEQAVHWISKAAELDHAMAQYGLGAYLINGVGIEQDMFLAAYWISLAAAQGQEHALKARDSVLENLNQQQLDTLNSRIESRIRTLPFSK